MLKIYTINLLKHFISKILRNISLKFILSLKYSKNNHMNLNPFIILLLNIIDLYKLCVIIGIIIHWLIRFNIINQYQIVIREINRFLFRITDPAFSQIRRIVPTIGSIDISPILLFLALEFIKNFLITYLYK